MDGQSCHYFVTSHVFKFWSVTVTSLSWFYCDKGVTITYLSLSVHLCCLINSRKSEHFWIPANDVKNSLSIENPFFQFSCYLSAKLMVMNYRIEIYWRKKIDKNLRCSGAKDFGFPSILPRKGDFIECLNWRLETFLNTNELEPREC